MTEAGGRRGPAGPVFSILAILAGAAALFLFRDGEPGRVAAGVLLLVAVLALTGVALGSAPRGPEAEGRLDLATRLGLGFLGGLLGAVAALVAHGALSALGLAGLFEVDFPAVGETGGAAPRLLEGSLWGLVFGVLLPWIPGPGIVARGATFSLVPSLLVLLVVFPGEPGIGILGLERGALTFAFVLLVNGVWGIVAGWTLAWGERGEGEALSAPLWS